MRFEPSEEAVALRAAVDGQLKAVTPAVVRAGWPGGDYAVVRAAWAGIAQGGLGAALVDESAGGLGLACEAIVPALEAIGYSGLPVPVAEVVTVAAPLLAAAGSSWTEDVLTGAALVSVAPFPTAPAQPSPPPLLPFGQCSELALLVADGALIGYERAELNLEDVVSVDGSRNLARVTGRRGGTVLCDDPDVVELAALRATLATAALLNGLARRMLDLTVTYVKERQQFGVAIGSFQAVKHALASALLASSFATPLCYAGAWELDHSGVEARIPVSLAKATAAEAAQRVARVAIQCHGAIGYTTEYDLQLFAKRVWALSPAWGDARWHRRRIARFLGLTGAHEPAIEMEGAPA